MINLIILVLLNISLVFNQFLWEDGGIPVRQGDHIEWQRTGDISSDGSIIISWSDTRNAIRDIYAQKIDWDETEKAQKAGIVSKHGYVHNEKEPISKYPFDKSHLLKIISLRDLDIGNPEMGEEVRINHIEPVKYLYNLKELSICNNTITSLKPVACCLLIFVVMNKSPLLILDIFIE